jgi:AcrR family transcriptional regulator
VNTVKEFFSMTTPRRERLRQNTIDEIKAIARQHMAQEGAGALSLRAIARDMGVTVTALYRYFPSYDDLITALIIDAFNALADALENASVEFDHEDYHGRLKATMLAYRAWAIANPADFVLIYGTPIPNYHAPREQTVPIVVRSFLAIGRIVADAQFANKLSVQDYLPIPATIADALEALRKEFNYGDGIPTMVLYLTNILWVRGHGIIMLELFGHLAPSIGDVDALYQAEMERLLKSIGL